MEVLAAAALFIVETLIPVVVEIALALIFNVFPSIPESESKRAHKFFRYCAVFAAGCFLGWSSTLVFPSLLLKAPAVQLLNLIASPIIAGFLVERASKFWLKRKSDQPWFGDFWVYFWFTLGFLAARIEVVYQKFPLW